MLRRMYILNRFVHLFESNSAVPKISLFHLLIYQYHEPMAGYMEWNQEQMIKWQFASCHFITLVFRQNTKISDKWMFVIVFFFFFLLSLAFFRFSFCHGWRWRRAQAVTKDDTQSWKSIHTFISIYINIRCFFVRFFERNEWLKKIRTRKINYTWNSMKKSQARQIESSCFGILHLCVFQFSFTTLC